MYQISYAKRLINNDWTIHALSNLLPQEHIFKALDRRVKTYYGAHKLFKAVESGDVRVYGAFTENNLLAGVCYGSADDEQNFIVHILFCRDVNAITGCEKCTEVMINEYAEEGIEIKSIIGHIPAFNRAAIRLSRKLGYEDMGETKDFCFVKDVYHYPCRIIQKKIVR